MKMMEIIMTFLNVDILSNRSSKTNVQLILIMSKGTHGIQDE